APFRRARVWRAQADRPAARAPPPTAAISSAAEVPESRWLVGAAGGRATVFGSGWVAAASAGDSTMTGSDGSTSGVVVGGAVAAVVGTGFGFGLAVVVVGLAVVGGADDVVV